MDPLSNQIETVSKALLNDIYCSLLIHVLSCSSDQPSENFLKDQSGLDPVLKNSIKQITESSRRESFSLLIIEKIEGCRPVLRQIWKVSLHEKSKSDDLGLSSKEVISKILNLVSFFPSQFFCYSASVSIDLVSESEGSSIWEVNQRPYIKCFPDSACHLDSFAYFALFQIEYCDLDFKPKITEQNLGLRPRLVSLDIEDFKDFKDFKDFLGFSNENPSPDKKTMQKQLSLITSESFYQENEIGFSLISSTLPDNQDSEVEELSQNSFDLDLEVSQNDEDSQVSLYIQKCVKMSQLKIFEDLTRPSELVRLWLETK